MRKFIYIIMALISTTSVFATSLKPVPLSANNVAAFNAVQKNLASEDNVTGHFRQIRKLQLLTQPLVSSGEFFLSKHLGLQWNQTIPFKSTLSVSKDKIVQKIGDAPASVLTEQQQPIVFAFTSMFLAIFNGQIDQVQHYFTISFAGDLQNWIITLTPNAAPLNKALTRITLMGGTTIESIMIDDVQKNSMFIQLSNVQVGQAAAHV